MRPCLPCIVCLFRCKPEDADEDSGMHFGGSKVLKRMSAVITYVSGLEALLCWLPGPYIAPEGPWTLIYRGSRDGWDAADFHRVCDNRGPTVVLVAGKWQSDGRGFVAGGYLAASWSSDEGLLVDCASARGSFLFSLVDSADHGPVVLPVKDSVEGEWAQVCSDKIGPAFGSDLVVGITLSDTLCPTLCPLNAENGSFVRTACRESKYNAAMAAMQGCTTFYNSSEPGQLQRFTTIELEVFARVPCLG